MNCEQCLDLISARMDGELTRQEEADLSAHLRECPACRAIAEDLQGLHSALAHVGEVEAPAELCEHVMAQIAKERQRTRRRFVRQLTGLAACLVLCVGLYQLNRAERPVTADPSLPSVARHTDPQPFDLHQADAYRFANEQHVRLSGMATSFVPTADLLGNAEDFSRFITRFPYDDLSHLAQTYDEEFFRANCLLAVVVQEPSSSITHAIDAVEENKVTVVRRVPQAGDSDVALWLILAELDAQAGSARTLDVEWINK